jgi:uncharacterized protein (TIGR02271 family)
MPSIQDVQTWRGQDLHGPDGKIGEIADVYLDRQTEQPEWLAVKAGLFGGKLHFVPIQQATSSGGGVQVPYDKDKVKGAPNVEADGELSPDEERQLYQYYGVEFGDYDYDRDYDTQNVATTGTADLNAPTGRGPVGNDVSGPETDEAMTRSEEELRIGTTRRETGRARLRKFIVTENVQQTVPVQREEVRVEREPITDANMPAAMDGPALSEEEHEVTLQSEQVVVDKDVVPKERVRLDKDVVTEQQTVNETVRGERIEVEGDVDRGGRGVGGVGDGIDQPGPGR